MLSFPLCLLSCGCFDMFRRGWIYSLSCLYRQKLGIPFERPQFGRLSMSKNGNFLNLCKMTIFSFLFMSEQLLFYISI